MAAEHSFLNVYPPSMDSNFAPDFIEYGLTLLQLAPAYALFLKFESSQFLLVPSFDCSCSELHESLFMKNILASEEIVFRSPNTISHK
jgi:hypothetical protein